MEKGTGRSEAISEAVVEFVGAVGAGFSISTHGKRLVQEVRDNCAKPTTGKPAFIQSLAKLILAEPNHVGAARALRLLATYVEQRQDGFDHVRIDHRTEFSEAVWLEAYATPEEGFGELARRRARFRRSLPPRVVSTIHKAKGLECPSVMLIPCDKAFANTYYSRCRLYVALSRASHGLTLVVPSKDGSPLLTFD